MRKSKYVCSNCNAQFLKWLGQCPRCGQWGTVKEKSEEKNNWSYSIKEASVAPISICNISQDSLKAFSSGSDSFDNFLGNGMTQGSVILFAGEPGVGKSTFLMQLLAGFVTKGGTGLYISGEESINQLKLRGDRLNISHNDFLILCTHNLDDVISIIRSHNCPQLIILDSIQTIKSPDIPGIMGGVSQIKEATGRLYEEVKNKDVVLILVSHITKEGQIAGPKALEHMVDVVLYMEGDRLSSYRILKITKNRFGPCNNILVLEMGDKGLKIVKDPSTFFLTTRDTNASGSSLTMVMEGQRPLIIEVQALVSKSFAQNPRRTSLGVDINRIYLLLAILEKRLGLRLGDMDVYVKIGAGIKITDPGVDLGVLAAIISSYFDIPLPERAIFWGEVDLNGHIRSTFGEEKKLTQATTLKFSPIVCPNTHHVKKIKTKDINPITNLQDLTKISFLKPENLKH